jgi:hypothetical protein
MHTDNGTKKERERERQKVWKTGRGLEWNKKKKACHKWSSTHLPTKRMNSYDDSGVCMCHVHTLVGGYQHFRGYNLEDGGSMHPWNVVNHLPDHKASQCLRPQNET